VILAGDVGATKVLLEAGDFNGERWQPVHARRYLIADFDNFADVLDAFMAELGRKGRFKAAALGVAGLAQGNKVKMTHRPWTVDGAIIARRFGIPRVGVVNDLAAAAQGIDGLAAKDLITVQPGKVDRQAPRLVMGVGTGLGVAFLLPSTWCQAPGQSKRTGRSTGPAGYLARVAPGEGGHTGFSPASAKQAALWQALHKAHGPVLGARPRQHLRDPVRER
jgi:glucokinase